MKLLIITLFAILLITRAFSHGDNKHENILELAVKKIDSSESFERINTNYKKKVKTIFKRSCFNCHGSEVTYPWYYKIPGIKQYIDRDILEAKEHLDLSNDFPFGGHDTPTRDLQAISLAIKQNTMPPLGYRVMHSSEGITDSELKIVLEWIKTSLTELKKNE
jgi:hypothetical protein